MSFLFGCMCNEPDRLKCALSSGRDALLAKDATDGWGLAFYYGGEPLLKRHPKPHEGVLDLYQNLSGLSSDYIVGQVREKGYKAKLENTQPFRFRSWVFAQSGRLAAPDVFAKIRARILEHVPDYLKRNIRGETDCEHLFALYLSFLHDAGALDNPNIPVQTAIASLNATLGFCHRLLDEAGAPRHPMNLVLANGRILLGVRKGLPLSYLEVKGVKGCPVCRAAQPADAGESDHRFNHPHLRAILLLTRSDGVAGTGWTEVPEEHALGVARDLTTSVHPLTGA